MNHTHLSVREQIIQTASRLFYEQGYNLTGINQIIAEAGVAKASLYYHFPSKEDLCVEYLQRRNNRWFSQLEAYLERFTDPMERIVRIFEFRSIYLKNNGFGGCGYIRIISELPNRGEKIDQQVIQQKERIRTFFQSHVEQLGLQRKKQIRVLTERIYLLFDGGTVQCQVYRDTWPMESAKGAVRDMLREIPASVQSDRLV